MKSCGSKNVRWIVGQPGEVTIRRIRPPKTMVALTAEITAPRTPPGPRPRPRSRERRPAAPSSSGSSVDGEACGPKLTPLRRQDRRGGLVGQPFLLDRIEFAGRAQGADGLVDARDEG